MRKILSKLMRNVIFNNVRFVVGVRRYDDGPDRSRKHADDKRPLPIVKKIHRSTESHTRTEGNLEFLMVLKSFSPKMCYTEASEEQQPDEVSGDAFYTRSKFGSVAIVLFRLLDKKKILLGSSVFLNSKL